MNSDLDNHSPLTESLDIIVDSRYLDFAYLEQPAYLEVKIWSLFKHENLTGNKILWKRGEIAPKEQFLLFSTIFSRYL